MKIELSAKHTLLLEGPAKIKIISGTCNIFGAKLESDKSFLIPSNRAVAIYATTDLTLDIKTRSGSVMREFAKSTIPDSWIELSNFIDEKTNNSANPYVIMFIGDIDKGKTTLITFIANILAERGKRVGIIDADIGQSDIGPPTTIGFGILEKGEKLLYLSQLECKKAYFVGSTSPLGILNRSIIGVKSLTDYARTLDLDAILIDTTGWVTDKNARELKLSKIFAVKPDLVVLLQKNNELYHFARAISNLVEIKTVRPSPVVKKRNKQKRKRIRETLYSKYLKNGRNILLSFDSVSFGYSFLGTGTPIDDERTILKVAQILGIYQNEILYIEESLDSLIIVTKTFVSPRNEQLNQLSKLFNKKEIRCVPASFFNGILVGLLGKKQEFLSIGVIQTINFKERVITIYTTAKASDVVSVLFGSIRIENHGEELGWIGHWSV